MARVQIIRSRETKVQVVFHKVYRATRRGTKLSDFAFQCDRNGKVIPHEDASVNNRMLDDIAAIECDSRFDAPFVRDDSYEYTECAILQCSCGTKIHLEDPLTNTCPCGAEYNMDGRMVDNDNAEEPWEED